MAEIALRELIDEKRLQHLQNEFCKVTGGDGGLRGQGRQSHNRALHR